MSKILGTRISSLLALVAIATGLSACVDQKPKSLTATTASSSSSSAATSAAASATAACTIFSSNSYDFSICKSCVTSTGSTDLTTLAQCVHTNSGPGGGAACVGLVCGAGQIANFATCSCQDALPTTTFGSQPGQDDTLTPILTTGLNIGSRWCPKSDLGYNFYCSWADISSPTSGFNPANAPTPPANVFVDTDYLRWDLSLDNSQFPAYLTTTQSTSTSGTNLPFNYSTSTLLGSISFAYNLKPNTAVKAATPVIVCDCVEHFSSTSATSGAVEADTCFTNVLSGACSAGAIFSQTYSPAVTSASTTFPPLSLNGPSANINMTVTSTMNKSSITDYMRLGLGLGKNDNASSNTGLFSNIGTYKYSIGPFTTTKTGSTTTQNTTSVTKKMSINMNLGYSPASFIESSAFGPQTIANQTVTTRTCSDSSDPCVVSTVYRTTGGAIAYQAFSPQYPGHASTVSTLPSGITSVSTPKIIEDSAQIATTQTTKAPSLRVFTRASDGNIYMSKGFLGVWSAWVNLGRPFITNTASVPAHLSSGPAVYWPFTGATTTAQNDGISIAGEPQVATYVEPAVIGTPSKQYIIIAVRVSHYLPSGFLGAYHNAIFYTTGVSTSTVGSFDTLTNWSTWNPVMYDDGVTPVSIQGNPALTMTTVGGAPRAYFFATKIAGKTMSGVSANLHPPIAPPNSPGTTNGANAYTMAVDCLATGFSTPGCTFQSGVKNWFSYGNRLVHGYIAYNAGTWANPLATGLYTCTAGTCTTPPTDTVTDAAANDATGVIISDWTIMNVSAGVVRLHANALNGYGNVGSFFGLCGVDRAPMQYQLTVNCGFPLARTSIMEFEFSFIAGVFGVDKGLANLIQSTWGGPYIAHTNTNIIGTPFGVPLDLNTPTGGLKTASILDPLGSVNNTTKAPTLLLGRNATKSSRVLPPTFQYMAANYPIGGTLLDFQYSIQRPIGDTLADVAGNINTMPTQLHAPFVGNTQSSAIMTSMFTPTSDIIGAYSNGLKNIKSDVPVYLFTRDANGKFTFGYWNSTNDGTIGPKIFSFRTIGVFTN